MERIVRLSGSIILEHATSARGEPYAGGRSTLAGPEEFMIARTTPLLVLAAAVKSAGSDLYFAAEMAGSFAGDSTWRLVDLRPLRRALGGRGSQDVPPNLQKIAWSYDAALIVPQMHASRFLNSPFATGAATSAP